MPKYITVSGEDAPWMTTDIKKILKGKTKLYVKNDHRDVDKINVEAKANECSKLISETKAKYLANLGSILNDPFIGPRKYWSILNTFLNWKNIPLIPGGILHDNILITDMSAKANIFNDYFISQCLIYAYQS